MRWFTVRRGRLEYRGRISRDPFTRWCATRDGREAIARVAGGIRFSLFGRARAAQRRLWRDLAATSRTEAFAAMMRAEPERYMQVLADACYAAALPRASVAVRRLVLTPRAMLAGRWEADLFTRLAASPALADLDAALRVFLLKQIAVDMDGALRHASPAPRRPVHARDGWACVGVQIGTVWMDSLWAGPDGTGQLFMYELPPQGLSRRDCKALDAAMQQMSRNVSSLSRMAREALLRSAALPRP